MHKFLRRYDFLSIAIIPNFKEVYISLGKDVPESFNFIINLKTFIFNNKGLSCVYFYYGEWQVHI